MEIIYYKLINNL